MKQAERIVRADALFAAWSSGDADAPRQLLTADAVLDDVIGGVHVGWPAIRAYFQRGLDRYPDLRLEPTGDYWHRADGIALTWVMSAGVTDDALGPDARGLRWTAPGMSYLVFDGGLIAREVDYHDHGSRERSIATAIGELAGARGVEPAQASGPPANHRSKRGRAAAVTGSSRKPLGERT